MGGTDVGLSFSGSSSATSGLEGNNRFGDVMAKGLAISDTVWLGVLGVILVIGVGWIFRK